MGGVQERLAAIDAGRVQEIVRIALAAPGATLGPWNATPLMGGASTVTGTRSISLLQGTAVAGRSERPWHVVLKGFAPIEEQADLTGSTYWKREWLLYGTGLLDTLPTDLGAPRSYGRDEAADGTVWLWQEYIQEEGPQRWPGARWALAARHLGRLNGTPIMGGVSPDAPWLGGERLRSWVERHRPLVEQIAAAPRNPAVRHWWPQPTVDAILRLWGERGTFCDVLARLPQSFGHGDAIRRNLLSRRGAAGAEETVAIDWEHAGFYAVGEEVGQTLSVAAAFFDLAPTDLPDLDAALFASYLTGLRDVGWQGDERAVRFAYAAHAALRNAFNAVGATIPAAAGRASALRNYGHSWEDLAARRAAIRPFLLERAEEARGLLALL